MYIVHSIHRKILYCIRRKKFKILCKYEGLITRNEPDRSTITKSMDQGVRIFENGKWLVRSTPNRKYSTKPWLEIDIM